MYTSVLTSELGSAQLRSVPLLSSLVFLAFLPLPGPPGHPSGSSLGSLELPQTSLSKALILTLRFDLCALFLTLTFAPSLSGTPSNWLKKSPALQGL